MVFHPNFATPARPQCSDVEIPQIEPRYGSIYMQLVVVALGVTSNVALLSIFSGRAKLGTASFTYIRILAIVQFVFFMLPFPLKIITEQYQRGQTWFVANFLPLLLGFFHFAIACVVLCFAVRLQLLVNYVTIHLRVPKLINRWLFFFSRFMANLVENCETLNFGLKGVGSFDDKSQKTKFSFNPVGNRQWKGRNDRIFHVLLKKYEMLLLHCATFYTDLSNSATKSVINIVLTRCRRWNSLPWVAWRKICFVLPFGVICNVSLAFEYQLDYELCMLGNRTTAIGRARPSEVIRGDSSKLEIIRAVPTMIYWLTAFIGFGFLISERCVLPKIGSPNVVKHRPLFANLRPLLISLIVAHSPVHLYYTWHLLQAKPIDTIMKLTLFCIGYTLPFPLMFIFCETFRSHIFHILSKQFYRVNRNVSRKDSTIRRVTQRITRSVAFSKLEMDNSEFEESAFERKRASMRSILRDDVMYRVRFAHSVAVIEERDEDSQVEETPDIESAQYLQHVVVDGPLFVRMPMYD